jgi:hypothetical protein
MDEAVEMTVLFQAAHAGAKALRRWVIGHFELDLHHIDPVQAYSLAQLDQAAHLTLFCGYDVSDAPPSYLLAIRVYMQALRDGREPRNQRPLPDSLIAAHRRIVKASEAHGTRRGRTRK